MDAAKFCRQRILNLRGQDAFLIEPFSVGLDAAGLDDEKIGWSTPLQGADFNQDVARPARARYRANVHCIQNAFENRTGHNLPLIPDKIIQFSFSEAAVSIVSSCANSSVSERATAFEKRLIAHV